MTDLSYPQRMGRILLRATEEVLGEEGLGAVLGVPGVSAEEYANDLNKLRGQAADGHSLAEDPSRYLERLEHLYGAQPGRGIARRIGRACVPYGLREFGAPLGLTANAFRLLPFPAKLKASAGALAEMLSAHTGQHITIEDSAGRLLWHVEHCPLCSQRHTHEPACHLAIGLAEEMLYWLSGGKIFQVEEIACIARGDSRCTLQIDPTPVS